MAAIHRSNRFRHMGAVLVAASLVAIGAATAGAADRVVLGEYFTSVF